MEKELKKEDNNEKKNKLKVWRYVGLVIVVLFIAVFVNGFGIYQLNWNSRISTTLADYIPYPAVVVNNEIIKVDEFLDNYNIIKNFQDSQIVENEDYQLDDGQIKVDVLNKLVLDKIILQLATKYGVTISSEEIDYEMDNIKSRLEEGDNLENRLMTMYGISEKDFIKKSLTPEILNMKLHQRYLEDESIDADAKQKNKDKEFTAKNILDRINQGEDFNVIAKSESEDEMTKESGGDLGFFEKGEMVPEFEQAAFGLEVDDVSDIIKTSYGYHIIKVTDKKVDDAGVEKVKASHILIKTEDNYIQWLKSNLNEARVYVLMREYKWSEGQIIIK